MGLKTNVIKTTYLASCLPSRESCHSDKWSLLLKERNLSFEFYVDEKSP